MKQPNDSPGSLEAGPPQEPEKPRITTLVLGPEEERQELLRALNQQHGAAAAQRHPVLPDLEALRFDVLRVRKLDGSGPDALTLQTAFCNADQAARIAETWKLLREAEQARCHLPGYALDFLLGDETQFSASICWQCNNIHMSGKFAPAEWATFDATAPAAHSLLRYCREVMKNIG